MKDKIRPIYSELQGYLSQAPEATSGRERIYDDTSLVNQLNSSIQELEQLTQKDYSRYKERIQITVWNRGTRQFFDLLSYRSKLGGLISRLYGEYFSDESAPFSGMPSTIINQHQSQSQTTHVQILLDFQSKIDKKIKAYKDDSKEKTFLEKVRGALSKVGNVTELFTLILRTGRDIGLTIDDILKIFS